MRLDPKRHLHVQAIMHRLEYPTGITVEPSRKRLTVDNGYRISVSHSSVIDETKNTLDKEQAWLTQNIL